MENKNIADSFDSYPSDNGRLVVPADRLEYIKCLDTSLDVEITKLCGFEGSIGGILSNYYSPTKEVMLLCGDGIVTSTIDGICGYSGVKSIFIGAESGFCKQRYGFSDLVRLIERLTADDGCEWDKVQTHESIATNMIEEAYEAVSAVLSKNTDEMREEFGDCLLQPVLNCDIAKRAGEFTIDDCIDGLCKKLYTRHTHIFGDDKAQNAADALTFWEKAKAKEKHYSSASERLDKLPTLLPTLLRTQKTLKTIFKELPLNKESLVTGLVIALTRTLEQQRFEGGKILLLVCGLFVILGGDAETALLDEINSITTKFKQGKHTSFEDLLNETPPQDTIKF